jgi:hypothetical protein
MLSKQERFRIFLERLEAASAAGSADEALVLIHNILNAVEDEFSGVPYDPLRWETNGRMYPPQEDNLRSVPNRPSLRRYRHVNHNTFVGENGSIRIETIQDEVLLDKAGEETGEEHTIWIRSR